MNTLPVDWEKENLALREELKRARMESRRLDQMKRDFIALAAHELRSPLAILLGYARILEEEATGVAHEHAAIVAAHAWQLKHLVDALLTLQQVDAGEIALRLENLALAEIVQNVLDRQQRDLREKTLTVQIQVPADLLVRADRERLALILANLLSNAIKYSPRGGTLTIAAQAEPTCAIVSLRDQGIGIPPEEQAHIFERFYQVGNPFTRRYTGLGLGLAVAKTLVELHNGRIWVESVPNQGSAFYFSLPRVIRNNGHDVTLGRWMAVVV